MAGRKRKPETEKSRNVILILYPENEHHVHAMEHIRKSKYNYLAVLHNRGLQYDDDDRKEHWHVIIRFPSAKWHTAIAYDLGVELNLIQHLGSFKDYAIYCTHVDYPDKAYFDPKEFEGSKKSMQDFVEAFEKHQPKQDRLAVLRKWINEAEIVFLDDLIDYASSVNKVDLVMSNTYLFTRLIDDHNFKIRETVNFLKGLPDDWKANMRKE